MKATAAHLQRFLGHLIAHHTRRTPPATEDLILTLRRELKESSVLGEYGDAAIQRELQARQFTPLPRRERSLALWRGAVPSTVHGG